MLEKLHIYKHALTQDMVKRSEGEYQELQTFVSALRPFIGEVKGRTILDIGCGWLYPFTVYLHSLGNRVIGIDSAYIGVNVPFLRRWWESLLKGGLKGFARDFLYTILLKNRKYYKRASELAQFPLVTEGIDIRQMNAEELLFPDETFDISVSIAVFEHISNVPRAVFELSRVIKKGGIIYIAIYLFTSLSGGHHLDWADPRKVPPWDHLRSHTYPATVYLNKLRMHEWLSLFREKFEILEVLWVREEKANDLLTREIRAECSDYSEQELLTKAIIIIGRK